MSIVRKLRGLRTALPMIAVLIANDPVGADSGAGQAPAQEAVVPQWVQEDWEFQARGNGRWIADNTAHKTQDAPYDAYGIEWKWGLGGKSLKGRLFAMQDGEEIGTLFELHSWWHPGEKRQVADQFGSDGTYATGTITRIGEGRTEVLQRFFHPDGTTHQVGHRQEFRGDEFRTQSYDVSEGGVWKERRLYVFKLSK